MGLDISAHSRVTKLRDYNDDDYSAMEFVLCPNDDFPNQADELKRGVYAGRRKFHFNAGSYSGYNEWRRWLCALIHHCPPDEFWNDLKPVTLPFGALIHFSDCEGVIGPVTSAKLAQDFRDYQPMVDALSDDETQDWHVMKYADWRKAFELASDNGAVSFQ